MLFGFARHGGPEGRQFLRGSELWKNALRNSYGETVRDFLQSLKAFVFLPTFVHRPMLARVDCVHDFEKFRVLALEGSQNRRAIRRTV